MFTFKGIQQVTEQTYLNIASGEKIGKLFFVKREDGYGDIYFGTRHYGHFSESEIEQIAKNTATIKDLETILKELRTFEYIEIDALPEGQTATVEDALPEATAESPEYIQVGEQYYEKKSYFRHNEYRIKKNEKGEFYLTKDGKVLADSDTISFKDFMVRSGSVVKGNWMDGAFTPAENGSSTALELVLNVKTPEGEDEAEKVYIDTTDLVDVYTVGDGSKQYISIDGYKVSLTEDCIKKIDESLKSITINGHKIDKDNLTADITTKDVKTAEDIKVDDMVVAESGKTVDDVVSGIYSRINEINKASVKSVAAATLSGVNVDNTDPQNPKISLSVETPTDATVKNGHIAIKRNTKGELYGEMYYITSDPDVVMVDTVEELNNGRGELTLNSDISTDEAITITNEVEINLNGKTITNTGSQPSGTACPAIAVKSGAKLTLSGNGTVDGGEGSDNTAVTIYSGGEALIEGGTYSVGGDKDGDGNSCIYLTGPNSTLEITGGEFRCLTDWKGQYYVVNSTNANKDNNTIVITGGKFWDFDPSNADIETPAKNYVPDGYSVTVETVIENEVEHKVYTVNKD